jgi:hypothetical protein
MSSCPPPPVLTEAEKVSKAAELAKAMGVKQCSTDQMSARAQAQVDTMVGSAEMEVTANRTVTVGCEQLLINASTYDQAVTDVTCVLQKSSTSSITTVTGINKITFDTSNKSGAKGGDQNFKCGDKGFVINQSIDMDIITQMALSSDEVLNIANATKTVVSNVLDAAQKSKSGLGATPQGSKILSDASSDLTSDSYIAQMREQINSMSVNLSGSNEVSFTTGGGNLNITGNNCIINQSIIIRLLATQIVNNALTSAFATVVSSDNTTFVKSDQQAENAGAESLSKWGTKQSIGMILGVILFIALAYFAYKMFLSPAGQEAAINASKKLYYF